MRRRPRAPPRLARRPLWARWDPAEQDGASYFGTARRERRHRPAAAVHAERRVNQVRQRARLSSPYTATNQVPLVAPSRRPPPPCSCSCRCTHLHGRFLASGGGWYSTDAALSISFWTLLASTAPPSSIASRNPAGAATGILSPLRFETEGCPGGVEPRGVRRPRRVHITSSSAPLRSVFGVSHWWLQLF